VVDCLEAVVVQLAEVAELVLVVGRYWPVVLVHGQLGFWVEVGLGLVLFLSTRVE